MEPLAHTGNKSTLDDDEEGLKVGMASIAKRPCSVPLEERIEDNFQPREEELLEYALWLGMNIPRDMDLIWIARDGLTQPLPEEWKPCQTDDDEIYYFNFETGESVWDHPCDGLYRKLYQEECKKLGKRPYQIRENSNWSEASTHLQGSHQVTYKEMLNEKEKHLPRGPLQQDDMGLERLPSKKEIQMNIVAKEIDSLKGIRDQLLQKMSDVWQGEEFSPLASQLIVEQAANFDEVEQNNASLLLGPREKIPSLEVEHFTELNLNCTQNRCDIQNSEEEDPRKTKERTEMLRKQLEMAKLIPAQPPNRVGGEHVHDNCRQIYEDHQRSKNHINSGPPMMYTSSVPHEASGNRCFASDRRDTVHMIRDELKKEELVIVEEMKERILMQVRKSMGTFEGSIADEYELVLMRKKENLEILRRELRKDMEFELLLEEEVILKRKREELLTRLHNQVDKQSFVGHEGCKVSKSTQVVNHGIENYRMFFPKDHDENFLETSRIGTSMNSTGSNHERLVPTLPTVAQDCDLFTQVREARTKGKEAIYHKSVCDQDPMYEDEKNGILGVYGVSSPLGPAPKGPKPPKLNVNEDLKELFLQCRRELRDDIGSLVGKMNEILVSHAKANQLNLETLSLLTVPMEENSCKTSHGTMLVDANPTQLLYTLQRSIGELDANLKQLLERKVGLASKSNVPVKGQEAKPHTQNHEKVDGYHPGVSFIDILHILKEFLVIVGEDLEYNTNSYDVKVINTNKSKYLQLPLKGDEALDMERNNMIRMSIETFVILKRLIVKIEKHLEGQIAQQEEKPRDVKAPGSRSKTTEVLIPKDGLETQSISLNEEISKKIFDAHDILTQFKAISTDMLSSLKSFIGQLDGEMKEGIQQCRREAKTEANGSRRPTESMAYEQSILTNQQILLNDDGYGISKTSEYDLNSGETISFEKLSVDTLDMLERFIGTLYHEIRVHISLRDTKASKDTESDQVDSKSIVEQNTSLGTNFELQHAKHISPDDASGTSALPDTCCSGLSAKRQSNSQGLGIELQQGFTSSTEHKCNKMENAISKAPSNSTAEDNEDDNSLLLHKTNPGTYSVLPKLINGEEIQHHDPILELKRLSTKSLYILLRLQDILDKELHDELVEGPKEPKVDATNRFNHEKIDKICHSSPHATSFEPCRKSMSRGNLQMSLDAHFISYDIILMGLERSIAEVDEELKAIIQNCKGELTNENRRMESNISDSEHHEVFSQTEESKLDSQSFIAILKAWATENKKPTQCLIQHFKSKLTEEMSMLQPKKPNEPSSLHSINCDKVQSKKPQHLTQVQSLVAEEKRIWYHILNDATRQWLQKEWVERLEHQSDLMTTCDNSVSPPNSESLMQVQKMLGEENRIMYDILNNSTPKLVDERNPLGSDTTSAVKESAPDFKSESLKGGSFRDEYSPCTTSRQRCSSPSNPPRGNDLERNQMQERSHTIHVAHVEEERQSNLFTNDSEAIECLHGNLNFCMIQSSCSGYKEDGTIHACDDDQDIKLFHNVFTSQTNRSSINHWVSKVASKAEPFGAFNPVNETVGILQDDGLCEECQKENILIHGSSRGAQGRHGRIRLPDAIKQLKLVSKQSWNTMQSKLRVAQATRWVHMIGSWAIEQMSCAGSCGLLLKKDRLYPTLAIKNYRRTILENTTCCKVHHSTNFEDTEDEMGRDNNEGSMISDDPRANMIQAHCCYPSMKPYITRPNFKNGKGNNSISPVDLEGELRHDFPGQREVDHSDSQNMNADRHEIPLNKPEEFYNRAERREIPFIKYQSSDDLAWSNVENTQCDCQTPMASSINLREVNVHELEEAINNLRKSRELEAKGKLLWVNHSNTGGHHFEDYDIEPRPTCGREFDNIKPLVDLARGDQPDVNQPLSNNSKYEQTKNGHMKGEVPNLITFHILEQGEIGFSRSNRPLDKVRI